MKKRIKNNSFFNFDEQFVGEFQQIVKELKPFLIPYNFLLQQQVQNKFLVMDMSYYLMKSPKINMFDLGEHPAHKQILLLLEQHNVCNLHPKIGVDFPFSLLVSIILLYNIYLELKQEDLETYSKLFIEYDFSTFDQSLFKQLALKSVNEANEQYFFTFLQ